MTDVLIIDKAREAEGHADDFITFIQQKKYQDAWVAADDLMELSLQLKEYASKKEDEKTE